jgi:hypothetical protein
MRISKLEYADGARLPWWCGVAYWRWDAQVAVCLPIPLNILVGAARDTYFWLKATRRPGWVDRQLQAVMERGRTEGYARGLKDGHAQQLDRLRYVEEKLDRWLNRDDGSARQKDVTG